MFTFWIFKHTYRHKHWERVDRTAYMIDLQVKLLFVQSPSFWGEKREMFQFLTQCSHPILGKNLDGPFSIFGRGSSLPPETNHFTSWQVHLQNCHYVGSIISRLHTRTCRLREVCILRKCMRKRWEGYIWKVLCDFPNFPKRLQVQMN